MKHLTCILLACAAASLVSVPAGGQASAAAQVPSAAVSAAATGEVWEWALGENVNTDSDLAPYRDDVTGSGIHEFAQGWEATVASDGTVTAVNVYNDEASIGLPQSSTSYQAYKGRLPGGVTWNDSPSDVLAELGQPATTGYAPGGSEADWTGIEGGKYDIKVYFFHDALHNILVSSATPTP